MLTNKIQTATTESASSIHWDFNIEDVPVLEIRVKVSSSAIAVVKVTERRGTLYSVFYGSLEPISSRGSCVCLSLPCFQSSCYAFYVTNCYFTTKHHKLQTIQCKRLRIKKTNFESVLKIRAIWLCEKRKRPNDTLFWRIWSEKKTKLSHTPIQCTKTVAWLLNVNFNRISNQTNKTKCSHREIRHQFYIQFIPPRKLLLTRFALICLDVLLWL